jgi:hypothetical protein
MARISDEVRLRESLAQLAEACDEALKLLDKEYTSDGRWPQRSVKDELAELGSYRVAELLRAALDAATR